jgi:hypothetical protein
MLSKGNRMTEREAEDRVVVDKAVADREAADKVVQTDTRNSQDRT